MQEARNYVSQSRQILLRSFGGTARDRTNTNSNRTERPYKTGVRKRPSYRADNKETEKLDVLQDSCAS